MIYQSTAAYSSEWTAARFWQYWGILSSVEPDRESVAALVEVCVQRIFGYYRPVPDCGPGWFLPAPEDGRRMWVEWVRINRVKA